MRKVVTMSALAMVVGVSGAQSGFAGEPDRTPLSVTIQGALYVVPGSYCFYEAVVSGGPADRFEWYLGGSGGDPVGTQAGLTVHIPFGTHVGLIVKVWSGEDGPYEDGVVLVMDPDGDDCLSKVSVGNGSADAGAEREGK